MTTAVGTSNPTFFLLSSVIFRECSAEVARNILVYMEGKLLETFKIVWHNIIIQ
jgi:hypothetical protein